MYPTYANEDKYNNSINTQIFKTLLWHLAVESINMQLCALCFSVTIQDKQAGDVIATVMRSTLFLWVTHLETHYTGWMNGGME